MKNVYRKTAGEVIEDLESNRDGLTKSEVEKRIKKFGKNKIEKTKKVTWLNILLDQFKSPLVFVLLIAGLIALGLGETMDSVVIFVALFIDVVIGFIQENRASSSLDKLLKKSVFETTVRRNNKLHKVNSALVVPGDIVVLSAGDKVPADGRVIKSKDLKTNEASLTGESHPRNKNDKKIDKKRVLAERDNMVYKGTNVVSGSCEVVVVSTGYKTELGKISDFIRDHKEQKTHVQKEFDKLAKYLAIILVSVIIFIFVVGLIRGHTVIEMFTQSVALAVSSLPSGLPVAITIIFAIGMQKVLKKKGLVRNLLATETLGRTEVLCVDKTGTLTEGKMDVTKIAFGDGIKDLDNISLKDNTARSIISASTVCNRAFVEKKDKYRGVPTEVALLKLGHKFRLDKDDFNIVDDMPFNQELNLSASLVEKEDNNKLYVCGSPESIIEKSKNVQLLFSQKVSKLDNKQIEKIEAENKQLSNRGYRIIAVAMKNAGKRNEIEADEIDDLTFLGLLAISDPLRKSAKKTVDRVKQAGLRLVVITGDQARTAAEIAEQIGIPNSEENILTGHDLEEMSDKKLAGQIDNIYLFVRVSPSDKVRIVKAWQKQGKVVAMTGDGINDAPSLHLADIGVAVGSGTDVAKESADIVLMDNNLETILNVIKEGRGILDNIKKVAIYLLSDSFAEVLLVTFSIVFGLPIPILATQLLWVNLVEDGLPDVALSLEPIEKNILKVPPRVFTRPLIDKQLKIFTFLIGWIDDIALISIFLFYYFRGANIDFIRTMVFAALTIDSLLFAFSCKSLRKPIWKIKLFNNKLLNYSILLGIVLLFGAIYFPPFKAILKTVNLEPKHWFILFAVGLIDFAALEITKFLVVFRKQKSS